MNDDLRDRLDAVEQAVGDTPARDRGITLVVDGDYMEDTDDLPPGMVLSSEYDDDGGDR